MKHTSKKNFRILSIVSIALSLSGCDQSETEAISDSVLNEPSSPILLSEPVASPMTVGQARQEAKPGQEVAVIGQVGGVLNPIAQDYASFVIADEAVYFCDEMEDEGCTTPWDACCEDKDKLTSLRASVVFLDEQGLPMNVNLKQATNLSELDTVTVEGVVAPESTSENLIIHATGFYNLLNE